MASATNPTKEMAAEVKLAKLEASKLKKEYSESEKATRKLGNEFNRASSNASKMESAAAGQKTKLDKLSEALEKAGVNTGSLEKDQAKLEKRMEKTSRAIEKQEKKAKAKKQREDQVKGVKKNAKKFAKQAAVIGGLMTVPIMSAISSESVMADVAKVADFETVVEKMDFEKAMREKIGTDIPMAFEDMGELVASAAQSGIGNDELLNFSTDAAKMSVAFDIDAGDAGEKMAKWRTAFGMTQDEVIGLADKINYLSDNSAASAPQISEIVSKIGALGEVSGINSGEVAAIGASMVSMGVNEDVAATAIKKMSTSLTKGAAATKKQSSAYAQLGLSSKQVAKDMQTDAQGTIIKVLESIKQLPKEAQTANITEIFGEQAIGALAPLMNNLDALKTNFANVNEGAGLFRGSMEKEFKIRSDTTENKLILLKNNMRNLTDTVGKILLPAFTGIVEKISEVAGKIQEWANANPELMQNIVEVALAIGGLILATSGLQTIMGAVSLLFSPIGLGLAALAAGAFVLVQNWDVAKAKIDEVLPGIWNKISNILNNIKTIWNAVWPALGPVVEGVGTIILGAVDGIVGVLDGIITFITGVFTGDWGKAWEGVKSIFESFSGAIGKIAEGIGKIIGGIANAAKAVWNAVTGGSAAAASSGSGGSTVSSGGETYSAYATGGVVTRPELAWVGEGGAHEAIIPLENKLNSYKLWEYAGQRIGALGNSSSPKITPISSGGGSSSSGSPIQIVFQIDATGAEDGVEEKILRVLREASPEFIEILKSLLGGIDHDNKRLVLN